MRHTDDPSQQPCRTCGHTQDAHQHYREGTDCGLCRECHRFVPRAKDRPADTIPYPKGRKDA